MSTQACSFRLRCPVWKDDYLIALAQRSGAECLVSGDQDLTVLADMAPPVGNPAKVIEAARAGRFVLVTSPRLLDELNDVLSRQKIAARLDPDGLARLREVLTAAPVTADPPAVAVSRDPVRTPAFVEELSTW